MKNIVYPLRYPSWMLGFLLAFCVMAVGPPTAWAATGSGTATAEIITPIEVIFVNKLDFGTFALTDPSAGGSITVPAGGGPTAEVGIFSTSGATQGKAQIGGQANTAYKLNVGTSTTISLNRTGPGVAAGPGPTTMNANLTYFSATKFATAVVGGGTANGGLLNGSSLDNLDIGGTLTIPAFIEPGDYKGTITVDVDYN